MELRYLGFEQLEHARGYRFDLVAKGDAPRRFVVTVDLALFRTHAVGIQEGPSLCAQKLLADLENRFEGDHQLTTEDLRAYAHERADAAARKVATRKAGPRRPKAPPPNTSSPWRGSRF
ncbi:MAG TPA: hypothetical protein VLY24_10310 [Bryobacteraceae bacterium]|nr:hypothetical protein [Bryobacteraceae bacterium]